MRHVSSDVVRLIDAGRVVSSKAGEQALATRRERRTRVAVKVSVDREVKGALDARELRRRARVIFRALSLGKGELSVVLTGDARIRQLNRTYRKMDKPTDVLAFAMREGAHGALAGDLLGDVIVSVETAARQARRARRELVDEVTMLVTHGILHVLGWDHDTPAKDAAMRKETSRLVAIARRAPQRRDKSP
jgi:probable rRNA maturation factor